MSAVMADRDNDEIAGRGNDLMQTWALHRRDASPRTAAHVEHMPWKERLDKAVDAEPSWVIEIDHMIAYLGRINDFYPRVVKRYYLDNQSVWEVAEKLHRTENFVLLSLRGVCSLAESRVPE